MSSFRCPDCGEEFTSDTAGTSEPVRCPKCQANARPLPEDSPEAEPEEDLVEGDDAEAEQEALEDIDVKPGDVLGGFRIEKVIARGGMGVVCKATQLSLDRPVALKVLPKKYAANPRFVRQFDSETAALASLHHANIVTIIDRGREGDTYYFAMEYVEGTNLLDVLRAGPLSAKACAAIFLQAAQALAYAHGKGVVHRDIKPGNIMFDEHKKVKIADFGLAGVVAIAETDQPGKRRVIGTPGYMSPEQRVDVSFTDERSDIFSMGAVMYRTLTGSVPEALPPPAPRQVQKDVDPRLDHIVLKCLDEDPEDRYQSAGDVLEGIQGYQRELARPSEVCPKCKKENPITEKICLNCGTDLSEMFDLCPECETENRRDIGLCIGCGANLPKLREQASAMVAEQREKAEALAAEGKHPEALDALAPVVAVKGRLYERARTQAMDLARDYTEPCRQQFQAALDEGEALAEQGKLEDAVRTWRTVPAPALEVMEAAERVRGVEETVRDCRESVEHAARMLNKHHLRSAATLLKQVLEAWPQCPGLSDTSYQLQALQQAEQMAQHEITEAARLIQEGQYGQAREVLEVVSKSMPNHPLVQQKLEELDRKERADKLAGLLAEAKEAEGEKRYVAASKKWLAAAELAPRSKREGLRAKAREAKKLSSPARIGEESVMMGSAGEEEGVAMPSGRRRERRKVLTYGGLAAAVIVVVGIGVLLYISQLGGGGGGGPSGNVLAPPVRPPDKPPKPDNGDEPPDKPKTRYFLENFDDGKADNWEFTHQEGEADWRPPLTEGRRMLRALADDGDTTATHKFYKEADCGVEAWVRVDGAQAGKSSIGLSLRRREGAEVSLRLEAAEGGFNAWLIALSGGKVVAQTPPKSIAVPAGTPFEGRLRVDALGQKVTGRVDDTLVGAFTKLPAALLVPGGAALRVAHCRVSWDNVDLAKADPEKLGIPTTVEQEPEPEPEPEPELPPLLEATPARDAFAALLKQYSLKITQSFDRNDAGWQGEAGTWKRVGGNRYGLAQAETAASFLALGAFADVEINAAVAPGGGIADSAGRGAGLLARYQDGQNYVFFGVTGTGEKGWTLSLTTCKGGTKKTKSIPGGPYQVKGNRQYPLKLVVAGNRACGYLAGKAMLSVDKIGSVAPAVGKVGLGTTKLGAAFDAVEVRALQPKGGGVALEVPEGAKVSAADPPALLKLGDTKNEYAFLRGLTSHACSLTVQVKLSGLQQYPQFGICCAAKGQRDVMGAVLMDVSREGTAFVRLVGFLPFQGQIRAGEYGKRRIPKVSLTQPMRLTLSLKPKQIECALDGKTAVRYEPGPIPLPRDPGKWGFLCTDLTATIQRIEIEL